MAATPELKWVGHMRQFIGQTEIKGKIHNPVIMQHVAKAFEVTEQKQWIWDDEIPYCGSFLGGVFGFTDLGYKIPKDFYRALSWTSAGVSLDKPCYGCVAVFKRSGGGHVGLVVGITKGGRLKILGANQGDQISIADFPVDDVAAYRWLGQTNNPSLHRFDLPVLPAGTIRSKLV